MENNLALQEPPCHLRFAERVATTVITKSAVGFERELVRKMTLCEPSHMPECPWPGLGPCETPPDRPDLPAGGRHEDQYPGVAGVKTTLHTSQYNVTGYQQVPGTQVPGGTSDKCFIGGFTQIHQRNVQNGYPGTEVPGHKNLIFFLLVPHPGDQYSSVHWGYCHYARKYCCLYVERVPGSPLVVPSQ